MKTPFTTHTIVWKYGLIVFLLVILFGPVDILAQTQGTFFNQRDDQYRLLGLRRAKDAFDVTKAEFERQQGLFDKQLISQADLERAQRSFSEAEVNYQQSLLAVLFEQQYVLVSRAVKYQVDVNRKAVRITLSNASGGTAEFQKLIGIDDELFRSLQPDVVNNVYVSLLNDENAIISQPYERKIDQLFSGQPTTLNFGLLQDLDAVTVNLIYGSGTQQSRKIYLEKDASVDRVLIQAQQFSQEVELGGSTDFTMNLELFSGSTSSYKLEIANLPTEINAYFVDPATGNRLSQFQFTEGINTKEASIRVFLPQRPTNNVGIDNPITYYALAIPREQAEEIGSLRNRVLTLDEIQEMNVGYAQLELVPRGIGEILVRAPQLYYTINPDEMVDVSIEVVNEGTRSLNNVRVEADPPLNWTETVNPEVLQELGINEEQRITLSIVPPEDITPGRYEVRVRTTSLSDDQPIRGEDKTVTIQVEQQANVWGTAFIILLIVGLVVGIVIFGIRLSRR